MRVGSLVWGQFTALHPDRKNTRIDNPDHYGVILGFDAALVCVAPITSKRHYEIPRSVYINMPVKGFKDVNGLVLVGSSILIPHARVKRVFDDIPADVMDAINKMVAVIDAERRYGNFKPCRGI
jgi:PemK-like, MazF-like toxin of type II toxin-antitoxin system